MTRNKYWIGCLISITHYLNSGFCRVQGYTCSTWLLFSVHGSGNNQLTTLLQCQVLHQYLIPYQLPWDCYLLPQSSFWHCTKSLLLWPCCQKITATSPSSQPLEHTHSLANTLTRVHYIEHQYLNLSAQNHFIQMDGSNGFIPASDYSRKMHPACVCSHGFASWWFCIRSARLDLLCAEVEPVVNRVGMNLCWVVVIGLSGGIERGGDVCRRVDGTERYCDGVKVGRWRGEAWKGYVDVMEVLAGWWIWSEVLRLYLELVAAWEDGSGLARWWGRLWGRGFEEV